MLPGLVAIGLSFTARSQDISYARSVIDTLSSTSMHGRGYVNNGCAIAADYIAAQMKQLKLIPFSEGYKQDFTVNVKTYPSIVSVKVNNQSLQPAKDFTIVAGSPSIKGTYKYLKIDSTCFRSKHKHSRLLKKDLTQTFVAYDPKGMKGIYKKMADSLLMSNYINCRGFIHLSDNSNLSWSVYSGQEVLPYPILTLSKRSIKSNKGKMEVNIELEVKDDYPVSNVIGYIPGSMKADSFLVITAHYDHLGMLGDKFYPGANDNASGVAMMLDLAREYSGLHSDLADNALPHKTEDLSSRPAYSVVFMAFAGEEIGLKGSGYQAENPFIPLENIKFLINLDMVGTGSEGITMVNAEQFPEYHATMESINTERNYVAKVAKRGESCNSDHCPFYKKGVPAVFIYSMGKEHVEYHNLNDTSNRLPLTEYNDIFRLIRDYLSTF